MRYGVILFLVLGSAGLACCRGGDKPPTVTVVERDPSWAAPLEGKGLSNFFRVSETLYRGAQPSSEGINTLKKMGVKTVVNLRNLHSDRDEISDIDMAYVHIRFNPWKPDENEVVSFLRTVTDPDGAPYFVHCQHGADRTGMMVAIYRMVVQGWSRDDAMKEMLDGGYGFHKVWKDIQEYVRSVDVKALKSRLVPAVAETGKE